jgi:hypothetical protein
MKFFNKFILLVISSVTDSDKILYGQCKCYCTLLIVLFSLIFLFIFDNLISQMLLFLPAHLGYYTN